MTKWSRLRFKYLKYYRPSRKTKLKKKRDLKSIWTVCREVYPRQMCCKALDLPVRSIQSRASCSYIRVPSSKVQTRKAKAWTISKTLTFSARLSLKSNQSIRSLLSLSTSWFRVQATQNLKHYLLRMYSPIKRWEKCFCLRGLANIQLHYYSRIWSIKEKH
jgi:hypothetical protein